MNKDLLALGNRHGIFTSETFIEILSNEGPWIIYPVSAGTTLKVVATTLAVNFWIDMADFVDIVCWLLENAGIPYIVRFNDTDRKTSIAGVSYFWIERLGK